MLLSHAGHEAKRPSRMLKSYRGEQVRSAAANGVECNVHDVDKDARRRAYALHAVGALHEVRDRGHGNSRWLVPLSPYSRLALLNYHAYPSVTIGRP